VERAETKLSVLALRVDQLTPFVFLVEDSTSSKYYIELHITVSDEKNYNLHVRFRLISPQCVAVQYSEGKSCSTRLQRSGLARVMV
jgi:hypothetical protein